MACGDILRVVSRCEFLRLVERLRCQVKPADLITGYPRMADDFGILSASRPSSQFSRALKVPSHRQSQRLQPITIAWGTDTSDAQPASILIRSHGGFYMVVIYISTCHRKSLHPFSKNVTISSQEHACPARKTAYSIQEPCDWSGHEHIPRYIDYPFWWYIF